MAQEGVASSSEDEDSTVESLEEDSLEEGEDSSLEGDDSSLEGEDSSVEEGESLEEGSSIEAVEETLSSEEGISVEEGVGSSFPQEARRREALSNSRRGKDGLFMVDLRRIRD